MKRSLQAVIVMVPFLPILIWMRSARTNYLYEMQDVTAASELRRPPSGNASLPAGFAALSKERNPQYPPGSASRQTLFTCANAAGQVAWSARRGHIINSIVGAFFFDGARTTDLGTLGGKASTVQGMNAAGHVVGQSDTVQGSRHAFLWRDGKMRDLGTLGGARSEASAINARDHIVGRSETSAGEIHAFVWKEGTMRDLGLPAGSDESAALGINDSEQVVGFILTANGLWHAVLWRNGKAEDLNRLVAPHPGIILEMATAIDSQGNIRVEGSDGKSNRTFLLTPTGR